MGGTPEVIALLERYKCPTPFHAVRTRFMGSIASPTANISPMQTIKQLWGGELPAFDTMEDLNHLFSVLVSGLWNPLTAHQMPDNPFKLTSPGLPLTDQGLQHFTLVRQQEIEGFVEGLFGSHKALDLPESAHRAVEVLGEIRAMLAGVANLLNDSNNPAEVDELKGLAHNIKEIGQIVEMEMNSAIHSCARARTKGAQSGSATKPTMH